MNNAPPTCATRDDLRDVSAAIRNLHGDVRADVGAIRADLSALRADAAESKVRLASLDGRMGTIETTVANHAGRLAVLDAAEAKGSAWRVPLLVGLACTVAGAGLALLLPPLVRLVAGP